MTTSFIYDAVRTPFGRYGKALAGVRPDDLAAGVLQKLMARHPDLDPARVDDVLLGDANAAGEDNRNVARMADILAGFPTSVPGATLNRLCGSGLEAVIQASRAIETGDADMRSEEHTSELQSRPHLVCRLLLEKKKNKK